MNKEDIRLTPKEVREAVRNCDGETDDILDQAIANTATDRAIEWMDEVCIEHDHGFPKKVRRGACYECRKELKER